MSSLPFVNMILQRGKADCGIAALAMYLGKDYEEVLIAASKSSRRNPLSSGMYSDHLIATAKRFKTTLVLHRSWDLESTCGLLTVEKVEPGPDDFAQHLVLLKFGLIFDTDGTIWSPDDYFELQKFRPVSIFVEEEGEEK